MIEFERHFKGTPAQFAVAASVFGSDVAAKYEGVSKPLFVAETQGGDHKIPSDAPLVRVWFTWRDMPGKGRCYVRAHSLPGSKSRLIVTAEDEYWPRLSELWEMLFAEMKRQGWIDPGFEFRVGSGGVGMTPVTPPADNWRQTHTDVTEIAPGASLLRLPDGTDPILAARPGALARLVTAASPANATPPQAGGNGGGETNGTQRKPIGKRGRKSQWSESGRDAIVEKWKNKDSNDARTLPVFLCDEVGEKDDQYSMEPKPLISESQFYEWCADYRKRHPE